MENLSGQTIHGYDLLERIGAGGFGAVYRAVQSSVGREVAVKVVLPGFANDPEFIRRFEMEAQLIARLEHLHIVPLYDYWRDPHGTYLVMRWLRGGSLSQALQDGPFDLEPAALLMEQVAAGLASAHSQQIVHRDLKPANILLDEEGNAYLADFGIARDLRHTDPNNGELAGKRLTGSLDYLSPEQLRGEPATRQSDIYSLGITLYELLTGHHPFPNSSSVQQVFRHINEPLPPVEVAQDNLSQPLNEVIQKATAKNPKLRYPDALALAASFRQAAQLDRDRQTDGLVESLTRREQEILGLIVEGRSNKLIAQSLFVEVSTVKWHITQLYKKLGVRSRVQATVRARELNLIIATGEMELEPDQATATSISVTLPEPVNPYKGLQPFEPADHRNFFGRETLVEHLLSCLNIPVSVRGGQNPGQGRFLAIVGPSGSGKSSLVRGGLIPAIWSGRLPGSEKWFIIDMKPGARPLDELEIALTRIAADQAGNLRTHLDRDNYGLSRAASLILPHDDSQLLVIIDQFEEIFTLVEAEADRAHFLALIHSAAVDPGGRVRLVIALRADFYDRPLRYPSFGELLRGHMETLLPLNAGELERAIVNPAQQAGVTFEAGLVASIIEEINYQPGALPLLQYALTELFEQRQGRLLTAEAYRAIGGATGALARRAETLYQEQAVAGREAIRQMFLRLVAVGEPVGEGQSLLDTRRRVLRTELLAAASDPDWLDEIIDTYAAYRLLSLDHHPVTRQPTVEVAHEAILREWQRLRIWLEESQADLSLHRQLGWAAAAWRQAGDDESFLLRGTRLAHFESWSGETGLMLTGDEQAYLDASLAQRHHRELVEQQRRQDKARLEQRANWRLKALLVVMSLALLVAIGLSLASFSFARQAEAQRRLAVARELASAASANLAADPALSLLLALEAAGMTYGEDGMVLPEVEDVLHQTIQADRIRHRFSVGGGAVAFSPDGQTLAIGGGLRPNSQGDIRLRLWDVRTGRELKEVGRLLSTITDIAFSPDGRLLAASGSDSLVKVWDAATGQELAILFGHRREVWSVAFSPNGRWLATASRDGLVRLWQTAPITASEGKPVQLSNASLLMPVPAGFEPTGLAFSPDGQRLAAFVPGFGIQVWQMASGELSLEISGVNEFEGGLAFSPDGNFLAAGSGSTEASIWDARTGALILMLTDTSPVIDVAFGHDGHTLATATAGGTTALWDSESGQELLRLAGHTGRLRHIDFSPDGRYLATTGDGDTTRIWDISPAGSREQITLVAHQGSVYDAIYSPDGSQIATTGEDGRLKLWQAATGRLRLDLPGQSEFNIPAFSPDGRRLAAANEQGGVTIWDVTTGQAIQVLSQDAALITAVVFSPDGALLVAGDQEGLIHTWDTSDGQPLTVWPAIGQTITRLHFSYHLDAGIWSVDRDGFKTVWSITNGQRLCEPASLNDAIWDMDITDDARLMSIALENGSVRVEQHIENGLDCEFNLLHHLRGHTGRVTGVAFSPEGSVLATSSFDTTVKLWRMDNGEELLTLTGHSLPVTGVDFSPDGRYLAAAGADGTVRIYVVPIDDLLTLARTRLTRDFSRDECQRYLHLDRCPTPDQE